MAVTLENKGISISGICEIVSKEFLEKDHGISRENTRPEPILFPKLHTRVMAKLLIAAGVKDPILSGWGEHEVFDALKHDLGSTGGKQNSLYLQRIDSLIDEAISSKLGKGI